MSLTQEAESLINSFVIKRKKSFYCLTNQEKCELVYEIIKNLDQSEKAGVLSDADYHIVLPDLIADVIIKKEGAIEKLIDGIMDVFINGICNYNPAFHTAIESYFNDAYFQQWGGSDEDFELDAIERTRAAQWGARQC